MGLQFLGLRSEARDKEEDGKKRRWHGVGESWKPGHEGWPIGGKSSPDRSQQITTQGS